MIYVNNGIIKWGFKMLKDKIKELRKQEGWYQKELAGRLGVSRVLCLSGSLERDHPAAYKEPDFVMPLV